MKTKVHAGSGIKDFRIGRFGVVVMYYPGWRPTYPLFAVHKWRYYERESWAHGTLYIGWAKVVW
jgi:hypothetical protein